MEGPQDPRWARLQGAPSQPPNLGSRAQAQTEIPFFSPTSRPDELHTACACAGPGSNDFLGIMMHCAGNNNNKKSISWEGSAPFHSR